MAFPYDNIDEVKLANKNAGLHWFDGDTKKFWGCRVNPTLYTFKNAGKIRQFFITSEDNFQRTHKVYSIREALPGGKIETVSFQEDETLTQAKAHLFRFIGDWTLVSAGLK